MLVFQFDERQRLSVDNDGRDQRFRDEAEAEAEAALLNGLLDVTPGTSGILENQLLYRKRRRIHEVFDRELMPDAPAPQDPRRTTNARIQRPRVAAAAEVVPQRRPHGEVLDPELVPDAPARQAQRRTANERAQRPRVAAAAEVVPQRRPDGEVLHPELVPDAPAPQAQRRTVNARAQRLRIAAAAEVVPQRRPHGEVLDPELVPDAPAPQAQRRTANARTRRPRVVATAQVSPPKETSWPSTSTSDRTTKFSCTPRGSSSTTYVAGAIEPVGDSELADRIEAQDAEETADPTEPPEEPELAHAPAPEYHAEPVVAAQVADVIHPADFANFVPEPLDATPGGAEAHPILVSL
ncbi:protein bangles and beads-like [Diachasma alloeum]|uniref:protein bangles and beads-like n=1 Tax=Diachasma alloeum TaxID=454923 RepID=UPI00073839A4|nr:protein bangles and beads-like [Diachasma alloeum]